MNPYLSIVIVVRNDNYGGDFTHRFQTSLNSLNENVQQTGVPTELILVNYNPLENETSFVNLINWPKKNRFLSLKMITVAKEVHETILNDSVNRRKLPVLEFIAKNVGIRQATAPFVLSTNADILLDIRFFQWLNSKPLQKGYYYRSNRFDFDSFEERGFSSKNVQFIYTRLGRFRTRKWMSLNLFIQLAKIYGNVGRLYAKLISNFKFLESYRNYIPFVRKDELFLTKYHLHACGDFTLTAKENWEKLRGYPEDTYSAMHADSLFIIACNAMGLKEQILKYPVYHQMHQNTFEHNAKNYYEDEMFIRLVNAAKKINKPIDEHIVNNENWGMNNLPLETFCLTSD